MIFFMNKNAGIQGSDIGNWRQWHYSGAKDYRSHTLLYAYSKTLFLHSPLCLIYSLFCVPVCFDIGKDSKHFLLSRAEDKIVFPKAKGLY